MNSVEKFDHAMALCAQYGWTQAGRLLGEHPSTLAYRIKSVYPDFKTGKKCRIVSNRVWFAEDIAEILEALSEGVTIKNIASKFNITVKTVRCMISRARSGGFDAYPKRLIE